MVSISVRRSLIASGGTSGAPDGVEAMSRGSNGVMPRPFEKLRDLPVRIPQVQPAPTSADTRVNCPRPAERPAPRRDRPFKPFLQVVAGNADMREYDVRGGRGGASPRGRARHAKASTP